MNKSGRYIGIIIGLISTLCLLSSAGCEIILGPQFAQFPGVDELPDVNGLPDPFITKIGGRVRNKAEWRQRREEIKEMMLYYQYGQMPPAPFEVTGKILSSAITFDGAAVKRHVLITITPKKKILPFGEEKTFSFNVGIIVPWGDGPFPVILKNDEAILNVPIAEEIVARGYIVADYVRTDLDPDQNNVIGAAQMAYPDYDWGTLAVWAWGAMRVIDYLVTLDEVDNDKIIFTGHSRGGKVALLAGALDERIAITVPNGSGCGGAGCYRFTDEEAESLELITRPDRFSYWFAERFRDFAGKETRLPFDQHFLKALVAPRALLSVDGLGDLWANPLGTQQSYRGALPVFDFLDATDKLGIYYRPGAHAQNEDDWRTLVEFADRIFFGKEPVSGKCFGMEPFPDAPKPYSWWAPK